jgi:hypothetical protein
MARLIAVILALLPLLASALEVDDLRATYGLLGREFSASGQVEDITPSGVRLSSQEEVSTDADKHDRLALAYRRSAGPLQAGFGAPLWGLELAQDRVHEHQGSISYTGHTQMLDLVLGWAWKVRPNWHVEQGLILGGGHAHWRQRIQGYYTDGADWDSTASGFAYEYGFCVGTYYTIADHLEIGIDARHLVTRARARFIGQEELSSNNWETTSFDAKFNSRGLGITFATGYRF